MTFDDFTADGRLNRWHIIDGVLLCPFDAIDPGVLTDNQVADIVDANAAARAAIDAVELYENALWIAGRDEPEETIEGQPNPEHAEWLAAREAVTGAAPEVVRLAAVRAGTAVDDDGLPVGPDPLPADEYSLAARKADLRAVVDGRRDELLTGGYTPASGPLAGHRLQTRDMVDRTNWLTSFAGYSTAVAAGQGDVDGARFRDADNVTTTLTYAEGLEVLLGMQQWGAAINGRSWDIKDAIADASDEAELFTIDINAGWPA